MTWVMTKHKQTTTAIKSIQFISVNYVFVVSNHSVLEKLAVTER
jgi:hypothetical protein